MDNPIDPSQILNAKVTERVYDDVVSPAACESGRLAEDAVKSLRLFTAPLQLLATWQDRYRLWLDDVRSRVPPERQVEAPAHIAGPVLISLRFIEDNNALKSLYLQLLTRAIDSEKQHLVHPDFVHTLERMAQDEALLIYCLSKRGRGIRAREDSPKDPYTWKERVLLQALPDLSRFPSVLSRLSHHIDHLVLLGLIHYKYDEWNFEGDGGFTYTLEFQLTPFGLRFADVCVPDDIG